MKKNIKFNYFYDKKTGKGLGVELLDGTIVLMKPKEDALGVAFPKAKFWEIFEKQMDTDSEYLEVDFSGEELAMIFKAISTKRDLKSEVSG